MKAIIPIFDERSKRPYYLQLYDAVKQSILSGEIAKGEKLPSLRNLSKSLKLSLTTIELAYNQLSVEGYIYSKPQSGFFVSDISYVQATGLKIETPSNSGFPQTHMAAQIPPYQYDLSCFDFNKWKKCLNKVITDYSHLLLFESDPQGEAVLRYEISKYLYRARGVVCNPAQIVIGAGTQQITGQLSLILSKMQIRDVTIEKPGYLPVKNIFRDRGFNIRSVAVAKDGISIKSLPLETRSAVYISPSNQFPTGAVMPVGKRYELLEWASQNDSIIIEDDYDSELRYFGKPIPALQGLDTSERVVYLGSFSSTLFPSIRISYMALPNQMSQTFRSLSAGYSQTCSKTEQLTLALFMEHGFYQTGIRKLRSLYAQKLQAVISAIGKHGQNLIRPINTSSGINMIIHVRSPLSPGLLCEKARKCGVLVIPVAVFTDEILNGGRCGGAIEDKPYHQPDSSLILYYNQIPTDKIEDTIKNLILEWKTGA